jgi:hypothetical protein
LQATVDINAPMPVVWEALTDYENLGTFIPSLVENRCLERRQQGCLLYQVGPAVPQPQQAHGRIVRWEQPCASANDRACCFHLHCAEVRSTRVRAYASRRCKGPAVGELSVGPRSHHVYPSCCRLVRRM